MFFETAENLVGADTDGLTDIYESRLTNAPPALEPVGDRTVGEGEQLQFTVSATDPDGDQVLHSASNLPPRASFDPAGGIFTWTPNAGQAGSYPDVNFQVSDGGASSSENITITVREASSGDGGSRHDGPRDDHRVQTQALHKAESEDPLLLVGAGVELLIHTMENLVGADTDGLGDVYERSGGATTLVSAPPGQRSGTFALKDAFGRHLHGRDPRLERRGEPRRQRHRRTDGRLRALRRPDDAHLGPRLCADAPAARRGSSPDASADGTRVFFVTAENLVGGDTDGLTDVYERSGGVTRPISAPGVGASGDFKSARFAGASSDGSRVFFRTAEGLVGADTDRLNDVYERSGGQTTLVSASGPGANGPAAEAFFRGASSDGTQVFLETTENLIGADANGLADIYERSGGQTTLVSAPGVGASGSDRDASFAGASSDGTRVFFNTLENLAGGDTDGQGDIYERSGGQTTLVSSPGAGANGAPDTSFAGASSDGARVFFETAERLVGADADGSLDVYESRVMAAPIGDDGGGETADGDGPDTTAPDTTIESKRRRLTKPQARIRFSSSEPGSSFECRLDKRPFKPCGSPKKLKRLKDGRHRFFVRAIDAAGNTDPSPAKLRFRVSLPPAPGS